MSDETINKQEYACCECRAHVIAAVDSPAHPFCSICLSLPGWWRDRELRDRFAHDEAWRVELAARALAESTP